MAIIKRAVASAANEKPANGVVKINSIEEPKAKQKAEAAAASKEASAKKTETAPAKKAEGKKAAAKPAAKKAAPAAKKTAAKKAAPVKKAAAKPAAAKPAAKKTAAKSAAIKTELTIQFNGHDIKKEEIDNAFEGVWTFDMHRKMSEVKKVDYYFKPEESAVYFVVNDGTEGRFEI